MNVLISHVQTMCQSRTSCFTYYSSSCATVWYLQDYCFILNVLNSVSQKPRVTQHDLALVKFVTVCQNQKLQLRLWLELGAQFTFVHFQEIIQTASSTDFMRSGSVTSKLT